MKIEMILQCLVRPVAGIAGHTSLAFKGSPTDWFGRYQGVYRHSTVVMIGKLFFNVRVTGVRSAMSAKRARC